MTAMLMMRVIMTTRIRVWLTTPSFPVNDISKNDDTVLDT